MVRRPKTNSWNSHRTVLHLRDPVPALEHPDEGVLRQVLGFVPVPGHEAERPVELILLGLEERLELDGRPRVPPR